jgi:hypothetical protein
LTWRGAIPRSQPGCTDLQSGDCNDNHIANLPTGNAQLRWAPGTAKPVVSWDFEVEID